MLVLFEKIKNAFSHVGAGKNVNLYTLVRNIFPYFFSRENKVFSPLTIFLSVNSICNLRCEMCDVGQKNKESSFYKNLRLDGSNQELDYGRLEHLIREVSEYQPKPRISITTTEPFLYKGLFKLGRLVSDYGMEFQVTTNGTLLDKYFEEIFSSGISELCISIDGKGKVHDDIRGAKNLYANTVGALKRIRDRKTQLNLKYPKITIATVISNFNDVNFSELFEDLDEIYYDRAIVTHMNFIDEGMVNEHNKDFLYVGKAEMAGLPGDTNNYNVNVDEAYKQILKIKKNHPKVRFAPDYNLAELKCFYNNPDQFVRRNRCYIPWYVVEILANGDVIPLTRCIHIKMGNIYNDSLRDIWNGEKFRTFRGQLRKSKQFPICRRCRGAL